MFEGWDSYYLLLGGAAGALIGLLFVVVTLTAGIERSSALRGTSVYMTPVLFHFAVVLAGSGVALAPRQLPLVQAALFGVLALCGFAHAVRVMILIPRRPSGDEPHWSDFWCYGAAPALIYAGLAAAALKVFHRTAHAPDAVALALLLLLLMAIRNAWDLVTWLAPRPDRA